MLEAFIISIRDGQEAARSFAALASGRGASGFGRPDAPPRTPSPTALPSTYASAAALRVTPTAAPFPAALLPQDDMPPATATTLSPPALVSPAVNPPPSDLNTVEAQ